MTMIAKQLELECHSYVSWRPRQAHRSADERNDAVDEESLREILESSWRFVCQTVT